MVRVGSSSPIDAPRRQVQRNAVVQRQERDGQNQDFAPGVGTGLLLAMVVG